MSAASATAIVPCFTDLDRQRRNFRTAASDKDNALLAGHEPVPPGLGGGKTPIVGIVISDVDAGSLRGS